MDPERRLRLLRLLLLFAAFVFVVGLPILMVVWPSAWMWEPRQSEYEQMILGVYATLGVFLFLAARDPLANLSLIWFTAWSSLVHGGIMAVQAIVDPVERPNLLGDVPALLVLAAALFVLTPRRDAARPGATG